MESRHGGRKEKVKVNINNFGQKIEDKNLEWERKLTMIGGYYLHVLFPYYIGKKKELGIDFQYPDLKGSRIRTISWVNDRVKPQQGCFVWLGSVDQHELGKKEYPIFLEFPKKSAIIGSQTHYPVSTPPGRPGNPTTILIDRDGEIVPELYFLQCGNSVESRVKVYLLSHKWDRFGWDDEYPALALQFLEGICTRPRLVIDNWQAYMMRNQA